MRSAVPVLIILSPTRANKKYLRNLVAYSFWHHYRTHFVKIRFSLDEAHIKVNVLYDDTYNSRGKSHNEFFKQIKYLVIIAY